MTDFKSGDRVQVKESSPYYGAQNWIGPGEVVRGTVEGYIVVAFDQSGNIGGFHSDELEPVVKPIRTRAEIEAEIERLTELAKSTDPRDGRNSTLHKDSAGFLHTAWALQWVLND